LLDSLLQEIDIFVKNNGVDNFKLVWEIVWQEANEDINGWS